jgi:septum formation protein
MAPAPRLILASSSPRRVELLSAFGFKFETLAPAVEETTGSGWDPAEVVAYNARLKAEAVPPRESNCIVLGADTVVVFQNQIFGKPASLEEARHMLACLNGHTHEVLTGVHLRHHPSGKTTRFVERTRVAFHDRSPSERDAYLRRIHPLDKAGAYAAQDDQGFLIASMEGSPSNVIGLPMETLLEALKNFGISPSPV